MIGRTKVGKQFIAVDKETILAPVPHTAGPHTINASTPYATCEKRWLNMFTTLLPKAAYLSMRLFYSRK
jgi:hypothetical protein